MDWWPVFDTIAIYGHLVHNLLIVVLAINWNVSLFMLLNLSTVCIFYMLATYRLQRRASEISKQYGLQSQCDLSYANMATKAYKRVSNFEFLKIRAAVWKFQFGLLVVAACIGFPSTILYRARSKLVDDPARAATVENIDWVSFYLFFAGIYKDPRPDAQSQFYVTFYVIAFGLAVERQFINWLTNRNGCTFGRL